MNYQRKPIPGFLGYAADTEGNIWTSFILGANGKTGEWRKLKPANKVPYPFVGLRQNGKTLNMYVHTLVLKTFAGEKPERMECRHLNGNKHDNRWPENICWGTKMENVNYRRIHGTSGLGEKNPDARLTEEKVRVIKWAFHYGASKKYLAHAFNVSRKTIQRTVEGTNWKHVKIFPNGIGKKSPL